MTHALRIALRLAVIALWLRVVAMHGDADAVAFAGGATLFGILLGLDLTDARFRKDRP